MARSPAPETPEIETDRWPVSTKLRLGYGLMFLLALVIGIISILTLESVVDVKDEVMHRYGENLRAALDLDESIEAEVADVRGYLLVRNSAYVQAYRANADQIDAQLAALRRDVKSPEIRAQVAAVVERVRTYRQARKTVTAMARGGAPQEAIVSQFEQSAAPAHAELRESIDTLITLLEAASDDAQEAANQRAGNATLLLVALVAAAAVAALLIATTLSRQLDRQVGAAVQHVQSSSAELKAAANQQASGASEQASAMNEIGTTIRELLGTARQIAESAQQVSRFAGETEAAVRHGERALGDARGVVQGTKSRIDDVVDHMLDLGRKSQRIGGILDMVNELTEQTNIVAINASIEAAGAGESGRRFAVVADEIRKLADRLGASTREIREQIEEVRAAVNTTVMATEAGSKAVDATERQFRAVVEAFGRIGDLVETTTEAAQEIELSTKQQTSAIDQVNGAISDVTQTTRETEASTGQTLQTASQLAGLSRELARVVGSGERR